jgi:hypothetical protein
MAATGLALRQTGLAIPKDGTLARHVLHMSMVRNPSPECFVV